MTISTCETDRRTVIRWRPPAPARCSWWIGLSREAFSSQACVEAARMNGVAFVLFQKWSSCSS